MRPPMTRSAPLTPQSAEDMPDLLAEVERLRTHAARWRASYDRLSSRATRLRQAWLSARRGRRQVRALLGAVAADRDAALADNKRLRAERDEVERLTAGIRELAVLRRDMGAVQAERDAALDEAGTARDEVERLADQVRVLAGLLKSSTVHCSNHGDHAEPGCEICRDAEIFHATVDGTETDRG